MKKTKRKDLYPAVADAVSNDLFMGDTPPAVDNPKASSPVGRIGTDESGKGDYFGPLVVAAVWADQEIEEKLLGWSVRDSKKITDKRATDLAAHIIVEIPHALVAIGPEKYNELYGKIRNLNRLLAWAHARAIENLLEQVSCDTVIADKFGDEKYIKNALLNRGRQTPPGGQMALQKYPKNPALERALARIVNDHRSGATKIALDVLRLIGKAAQLSSGQPPIMRRGIINDLSQEVVQAHPQMGILYFLQRALRRMKSFEQPVLRKLSREFKKGIIEQQSANATAFAGHVRRGATVLTLSYSSAVAQALVEAQPKKINVVLSESRPKNEGRALARFLYKKDVPVTLTVDAALGLSVPTADTILLGSDAVTPEFFVNKIGSLALCLLARQHKIPAYVLTDSYRLLSQRKVPRRQVNHTATEVVPGAPAYTVDNRYFDFVPLELVNKVICNGKVLSPRRLF
jgi:translation initiation factor 2B subunit (eIF-2B alpha/beta/delta family)